VAKKRSKRKGAKPNTNQGAAPARTATMTLPEKISWWSIVAMVFVVPLAMANWTWLGFQLPLTFDQFDIMKIFSLRAFTLVAFGAWAWHILLNGGTVRRTKIDYLVLALLGWILLTSFTSIHPPTAFFGKYRRFEGFISFANYAAIFWLVTQFIDRASRIKTLANSLFFSAVLVNIYGLLQYLGLDPITWGSLPFEANRAFATYGNPDLLGGFLVFPLVLSMALAMSEERKVWRAVYWSGFLLTVLVWIVAFVRGAWIGGLVGLAVLIVFMVLHKVKFNVVDYAFAGASAALGGVVVARSLNNPHQVLNVWTRIKSITDFDAGSARTRFQIWDAAWEAVKAKPIFGHGADTFRLVFPKYKPFEYVEAAGYLSVADNVHNYPLQMASALGIPGVLLLYATFFAAAWFSAPMIFQKREKTDRLLLAGFWAAAAAYVVHLMFGISVTGSTFLLWIAMAIVLSPTARTVTVRPPKWGVVAAGVTVVLIAALFIGNIVYIVADNHYLQARVVKQDMERVREVERAIALNPFNDMYRAELGLAYTDLAVGYVAQLQAGNNTATSRKQAELLFSKAEDAYLSVIDFVPWEYDNYVFITNTYNLGAEYLDPKYTADAIEWGEKGVEVEPYGPAIRFQLSRALVRDGRLDEAREHMELALELDPKYTDGMVLLADIYRQQGELELALEWYNRALARSSDLAGIEERVQAIEASLAAQ